MDYITRCSAPVKGLCDLVLEGRTWDLAARVSAQRAGACYSRMDPAVHRAELAAGFGLTGEGAGLLTAARVAVVQGEDEGVRVVATVGLRVPTWAAVPPGTANRELVPVWWRDAINIIVSVSVPLRDAPYVNAVMTATEAKPQPCWEAGFRATGTATAAICVAAPA